MKPQIISFRCVLRDAIGTVISTTFSRDVLTQAQPEEAEIPGLARRLKNLKKGERRRIALDATEAYGLYDPELVVETSPRSLGPKARLRLGEEVQVHTPDGALRPYRVTTLTPGSVVLDGNHPLAGQDLTFDIEVTDVRYATKQEIADAQGPAEPRRLWN